MTENKVITKKNRITAALALLAFWAIFACIAIPHIKRAYELQIEVVATCTDIKEYRYKSNGHYRTDYLPVFEFEYNGTTYSTSPTMYQHSAHYTVGNNYTISVLERDPSIQVSAEDVKFFWILLIVPGVIVGVYIWKVWVSSTVEEVTKLW